MFPFYGPPPRTQLETENLLFSDISRGYKIGTWTRNGVHIASFFSQVTLLEKIRF